MASNSVAGRCRTNSRRGLRGLRIGHIVLARAYHIFEKFTFQILAGRADRGSEVDLRNFWLSRGTKFIILEFPRLRWPGKLRLIHARRHFRWTATQQAGRQGRDAAAQLPLHNAPQHLHSPQLRLLFSRFSRGCSSSPPRFGYLFQHRSVKRAPLPVAHAHGFAENMEQTKDASSCSNQHAACRHLI